MVDTSQAKFGDVILKPAEQAANITTRLPIVDVRMCVNDLMLSSCHLKLISTITRWLSRRDAFKICSTFPSPTALALRDKKKIPFYFTYLVQKFFWLFVQLF